MDKKNVKHGMGRAIPIIVLTIVLQFGTALAERKPEPKAEILQPKAGQVLEGRINVQLKLPIKLSGRHNLRIRLTDSV